MRLVSLLLILLLACGRAFAAGAPIPSGSITASGNQLTTAGQNIRLSCVDYIGSTPATDVPIMRSAGFNCVRVGWFDTTLSFAALDPVVAAATTNSMRVLIAHLGNQAGSPCGARQQNGVWYDLNGPAPNNTTNNTDGCGTAGTITYATFKTNWTTIATHYAGNETVMGFDLHHEPFVSGTGLTIPVNWGGNNGSDALAMCNDVGSAVVTADSNALVICEAPINAGTLFSGAANSTAVGDLTLAQTRPVVGGTPATTRNTFNVPFQSTSVWNVGMGSGAIWGNPGDPDVAQLQGLGGKMDGPDGTFGAPLFFGQASDPLVTASSQNFVAGTEVSIQLHVPANARQSQDSDNVISLADSTQPHAVFTGSNNCVLSQSPLVNGSTIQCGIGNIWDPLGDGVVDTANYHNGIFTAVSDYGQYPGIITMYDLAQGVINHAMRFSIPTSTELNPGQGGNHSGIYDPCSPNVPWPNFCVDGSSHDQYDGLILAGSTIGIPASVNINALGLSQGGLMLATALQKYGAFWRDTGGFNTINFYSPPEAGSNPLYQQMDADLRAGKIVPHLSILRNQSGAGPDGRGIPSQYMGGGTHPPPLPTACANAASTIAGTSCGSSTGAPIPSTKVVYAVHEFPTNVGGRNPDSSSAWITLSNTAYGYLVKNGIAPVIVGSMGASLDGSNGALADDQGWASTITGYLNGTAINGPVFAGCQQPMGLSWHLWGNNPSLNPNGTNNSDGTFRSGQQAVWSTLQFTPTCTGGGGVQTTWNPSDNFNSTLTGNNLISTSVGTAGVRSTTSKSSGKFCAEVIASTNLTGDWDVGLADSTMPLDGSNGGLGGDTHGIGFDLLSGPGLGIFFNNVVLSSFATSGDVTGAAATMCFDLGAKLGWFTSPYMRAQGNPWNNSATANPATATGGLSISGLTCPCFIAYQNFEAASAATLNTRAPFAVGLPAGFAAWDVAAASGTHPILINLGANDNLPKPANDNVSLALNLRRDP